MKFDYIIYNPPFNKSLDLDFFDKGLDLLSETGKMVIIEPATWLIQLKENGKYTKETSLTVKLKKRIEGHVSKVIIENYNKEFNIANTVPFSITYLDYSKKYNTIDFYRFGEYNKVSSIYDCNHVGYNNIIKSIFKKIKQSKKIANFIVNKQFDDKNIYYIQISNLVCPISSMYFQRPGFALGDSTYFNTTNGKYFQSFISPIMHPTRNNITNIIPCKAARGGSSKGKVKLTDKPANCVYGLKNEMENYKYYVISNSLPLFLNICLSIDQNNNSLDYVPWLVDKKYTDEEIYKLFNFTEDEIKLIEMTIKKCERYSPWFKRYICGPSSVSDEEVQKFIDNLNNA